MRLATAARKGFFTAMIPAFALTLAADAFGKGGDEPAAKPPVDCGEAYSDVQSQIEKRAADASETASVTLARAVIPTTGDDKLLETARGACREASAPKKAYRLPAYLCIGEASAKMGDQKEAYCAFNVAAQLANRTDPVEKKDVAGAEDGLAVSLMALGKPGQAIDAYEAAIAAEPTAQRRLALGKAHLQLARSGGGDHLEKAEKAILKAADEGAGAAVAVPLVTLARLKQQKSNASAESVINLLERAQAASPTSVAANGALGVAYYETGRTADATKAFEAATKSPTNDSAEVAGLPNYRAESYYYLSLIDAAKAKVNWDTVVDNAGKAAIEGGADTPRYRRQACLANIARGRVENMGMGGPAAQWCDRQDTPEAQLLRGMFLLRRAQYSSNFVPKNPPGPVQREWLDYVSAAETAFTAGLEASKAKGAGVKLDWPELASTDLTDQALLTFGLDVVRHIDSYCQKPRKDQNAAALKLYTDFHVSGCRP